MQDKNLIKVLELLATLKSDFGNIYTENLALRGALKRALPLLSTMPGSCFRECEIIMREALNLNLTKEE